MDVEVYSGGWMREYYGGWMREYYGDWIRKYSSELDISVRIFELESGRLAIILLRQLDEGSAGITWECIRVV